MSNIDKAYTFYDTHIYDKNKFTLLEQHGFKTSGSVPSVLWELFGSILTGRSGAGIKGADLQGWEIKSAKQGGSYEYQYHLNSGLAKLEEDCVVNHLFCTYSETYKDVTVRAIKGADLAAKYFRAWQPEYLLNYDTSGSVNERRQRFRRSIPFGYIKDNAALILRVEDGKLIFRDDTQIFNFNANYYEKVC